LDTRPLPAGAAEFTAAAAGVVAALDFRMAAEVGEGIAVLLMSAMLSLSYFRAVSR
jgi:hypothetical protein